MAFKSIAVALVALTCLLVGGASAPAQTREELREEFNQTYVLRADGRVSLQNTTGALRIEAWDRNEVRVAAVKRAYTRELLAGAEIRVEASQQVVRISTKYSSSTNTWNFNGEGRYDNPASVDYTLTVPRGARIDTVELVNGSLELGGLAGYVEASSINGPIRASELTGEVRLSTVNGRLELTLGRAQGQRPVTLTSVNGPVVLTLRDDAGAELTAATMRGRISNDFGLTVTQAGRVGHELAGTVGRGVTPVRLTNVNGDIEIRAARAGRAAEPPAGLNPPRGLAIATTPSRPRPAKH